MAMKTLIVAAIIALAIIIALVATPYLIPTQSYKALIEQSMGRATGMQVRIDKIRARLIPYPAFTIHDIRGVVAESSFQKRPTIRIAQASGSFSIIDIFKKRLSTGLTITGFAINYMQDEAGATNLDRMFISLAATPSTNAPTWKVAIDTISAADGTFTRYDAEGKAVRSVRLSRINLTKAKFGKNIGGRVYLKAAAFGSSQADVEFGGTFVFERSTSQLHLRDCSMALLGTTATLDATLNPSTRPMRFEMHGATPSISSQQIAAIFPALANGLPAGISWGGNASLDLFLKGTGEQTLIRFQTDLLQSNVTLGKLFVKPQGRLLKVGFAGIDRPSHLDIEALNIRLGDNLIQVTGTMLHQPDHQAQLTIASEGFKLEEIQPSLQWLAVFQEAQGTKASITVQGSLDNPANRLVFGQLSAATVRTLDIDFSDFKIDFHQKDPEISLPIIKANAFDGELSGSGIIELAGIPRFNIQAVINNADLNKVPLLGGAIKGQGSLVFKATMSGTDASALQSSLSSSGTLIMTEAQAPNLAVGKSLLGAPTWSLIESTVEGVTINQEAAAGLESMERTIENLHASFYSSADGLVISDLRGANPRYTLWLHGTISPQGLIECTGSVWLRRKEFADLVAPPKVRASLSNKNGDLQIPFILKGKGAGLILRLEDEAFKDILKGEASPTPVVKDQLSKAPEPTTEPKPPQTKKAPPSKPRSGPRRKATPIKPSQEDDVMKVLIR